jgi:hypothetical protein
MHRFKVLYTEKNNQFLHFDQSPLDGEVLFYHSDMPMIMNEEIEVEDLLTLLGEETIFPEGTELKTIEINFIDVNNQLGTPLQNTNNGTK